MFTHKLMHDPASSQRRARRALPAAACVLAALGLPALAVEWSDNFDSYTSGQGIIGKGGWTGWDGSATVDATVSTAQASSAPNSLQMRLTSDVVKQFNLTSGMWTMRAKVFIPSGHTGGTDFIMLNTYQPSLGSYNWSVILEFRSGRVTSYGGDNFYSAAGASMPHVFNAWADIRVDIDLDANTQQIYYNGALLHATAWRYDGAARIQALDLFSYNGSAAYFDDIVLEARTAAPDCNTNGIDDATDIADGTSEDCDRNGIPDECLTIGEFSFAAARNYPAGGSPLGVAAEDLDGDGLPDLAIANYEDNVAVLLGNGDGTFAAARTYAAGDTVRNVLAVDVDKDGDKDLVTANVYGASVSVFINKGDGTFNSEVRIALPDQCWGVAAADLDRDGDIDLAATGGYQSVWILANNGSGAFALAKTITGGIAPNTIAAADLDGDGDADLVTGNNMVATGISVLKNNGGLNFGAPLNLNPGERVFNVALADLDGDGDTDIAATGLGNNSSEAQTSSSVFVLANNGNATFAAAKNYPVGSVVENLTAADLDADGAVDLAAVGSLTNVWVLPNNRRGGFGFPVALTAGNGPTAVAAGDFDDNGMLDLAVTCIRSYNVSVLLNESERENLDLDGSGVPDLCEATDGNWLRADANGDRGIDIGDAIFTLTYLFANGPDPECLESSNSNSDANIDIGDAIFTLTYLFGHGPAPRPPFPRCELFPGCRPNCPN